MKVGGVPLPRAHHPRQEQTRWLFFPKASLKSHDFRWALAQGGKTWGTGKPWTPFWHVPGPGCQSAVLSVKVLAWCGSCLSPHMLVHTLPALFTAPPAKFGRGWSLSGPFRTRGKNPSLEATFPLISSRCNVMQENVVTSEKVGCKLPISPSCMSWKSSMWPVSCFPLSDLWVVLFDYSGTILWLQFNTLLWRSSHWATFLVVKKWSHDHTAKDTIMIHFRINLSVFQLWNVVKDRDHPHLSLSIQ